MSDERRTRLKRWLESGEVNLQPLTLPQRELWETSAIPVGDVSNHICTFIEVRGALSPEDCEVALQRVVERQEVLRLSILPGKEHPVQMIRAKSSPTIRFHDISMSNQRSEALEELMHQVFTEPFDLVQGPLYRADVVSRGAKDCLLVFTIHHAIADGWSLAAFVKDLCAAYALEKRDGSERLPPLQLSYSEWGTAERAFWQTAEIERRAPFWRSHLEGAKRLCTAPVDLAVASAPLRRTISRISPQLTQIAKQLARRTATTLFSTLLASFQVALSRWAGATDIVVGTPVANRSKQAVHETMGYCSGIVPLRGQVERDRRFSDTLRALHGNWLDCFANAMPFAELVKVLGNTPAPGKNPIFDVRFALQNHPPPYAAVPGFSVQLTMRSTGTARFHLGCEITEQGDALEVVWLFRPGLFSKEEVQKLGSMFEAVLASFASSPDSRTAVLTI
jgi:condensation domain-containing protein